MTTPARKLAKQGGAPTVNRMSLPRISVQGTMVFQKPHRRGAVGRQEARKGGACAVASEARRRACRQPHVSFFYGLIPGGWLLNVVTRSWKIEPDDAGQGVF